MARNIDGIAFDHEVLTVTSAVAVGFTDSRAFPVDGEGKATNNTDRVYISVERGMMRYLTTSVAPTSTVGHPISNGASITITGDQNIRNFKAIAVGNTDGILQISYESVR